MWPGRWLRPGGSDDAGKVPSEHLLRGDLACRLRGKREDKVLFVTGGTYDPDTWVDVTVTPELSREFVQILWEDGSAICDHPVRVKMDEDKSGTVVCTSAGTYALRVYTGNMAPVWFDPPGGVYAPGTTVTISCSCPPDQAYIGIQWEDGTLDRDDQPQVTMYADKTGDVEYQQLGWPGPE